MFLKIISFQCPWRNQEIEKDVDFAQKVIKSIRSARSTYNLPNKTKTEAYFVCTDSALRAKIESYESLIGTLAYSIVNLGEAPSGCAIITVTDKLQVHLVLKGLIDPVKELEKLGKKEDLLGGVIDKLKQAMAANDYATKVPVDVQTSNKEKLEISEGELERLTEAMQALRTLI